MADERGRTGRWPVVRQGAVDRAASADLDERKAAILNAVVTEHIDTAQPVGSGHVTGLPGVEVSSATVRSEMSALERDGYLVQPHTSAGRIPTDKGYRFFVDHLARPGVLGPSQRQQVRKFYADMHLEMEELLERTGAPALRADRLRRRGGGARPRPGPGALGPAGRPRRPARPGGGRPRRRRRRKAHDRAAGRRHRRRPGPRPPRT